jgi:hypothetical protein
VRAPPAPGLQIRRVLGIPVDGRPAKTATGEQRWTESAAQRRPPNNPPRRRCSKQRGAYDSPPWLASPPTIRPGGRHPTETSRPRTKHGQENSTLSFAMLEQPRAI